MEPEPLHTAAKPPTPSPHQDRSRAGRGRSLTVRATRTDQPVRRWPAVLATALALIMVLAMVRIVLAAVSAHSSLVPSQPNTSGWLLGITGERLTYPVFLSTVIAFSVAYGGLAALSRHLSTRALIALISVLYAVVLVGPIIVSTDVFSYIAYARMGLLHGLNPYVSGPFAIHHDPSFRYVGTIWLFVPTAYGPLYTLLSYPLALVGLVGAVWGMKLLALASMVAIDWLVWRCARLRDFDPKLALILVGLNPLVVIYSLGSAQNDLLMLALMMLGVFLTLAAPAITDRSRGRLRSEAGGAAIVLAALVKVPAAAVLPYLLISRRRVSALAGAITMLVAGFGVSYLVFGIHGVNLLAGVNRDSAYISVDSFALQVQHMLGKPGIYPIDRVLLKAASASVALYLLWRTWRGYDWIAASGWALLTVSVAATWIQPWYLIWPLPLAVIARDRRLVWGTLLIQALFIGHQLSPLFAA